MKSAASVLLLAVCLSVAADDTPPVPPATPAASAPFILQTVEEKYSSDVAKAEAELAKAKKAAAEIRLKAYKERLAEVTKSGDFDKAIGVKARVEQLEKEPESAAEKPTKRPRPKDVVKFGGHTYALIKEPATWHVAKQRCEEMGGHLVCVETEKEEQFVKSFCGQANVWVGASDEETEGSWKWCSGDSPVRLKINVDDSTAEHHLSLFNGEWHDGPSGHRHSYVCEWDR